MDLGFEHQTLRVHQEMALSSLYLLSTVVTTLLSAYPGCLYTDWLSTTPALG
jgi:hypothetical protein